jgi:hypothetical protein
MITNGYSCTTNRKGTGMENCQPPDGLPVGWFLVPKGWSLNKETDTFDSAYVDEQIQTGSFIPFVGTFEMTGTTPDATTQESQSGIISVVRQGKPTFTGIFKKGRAFQAAAYSYNSDGEYDVLLVFSTGLILGAQSVDGTEVKGLTAGMVNTNGYSENTGAASAQTTMMFQLTNPLEYNQNFFVFTDLDFDPQAKTGIINTVMTLDSVDVSDSKAIFSMVWEWNAAQPTLGGAGTNFRLVNSATGVALTTTAATRNATTGKYELTTTAPPTLGQSYYVETYDSTIPVSVAKIGQKFYAGKSNTVVAVA